MDKTTNGEGEEKRGEVWRAWEQRYWEEISEKKREQS